MAENDTITVYGNEPYHDDLLTIDKDNLTPLDKNYLRVLFKPGRSVQSRELNQIQSVLQAQIDRFGKRIFKTNHPILGGETTWDSELKYIDVLLDTNNNSGDRTSELNSWLAGDLKQIELSESGRTIVAIITKSEIIAGSDIDSNATHRFFIKYKSIDTDQFDANQEVFSVGNTLVIISNISEPDTSPISVVIENSGDAVAATINPGFFFIRGAAAQINRQYVAQILDPEEELFSGYVGVEFKENIITSNQDATLLDNANGVNAAFIGADRYQIDLNLVISKTITDNFVKLLDIRDSKEIKKTDDEENSDVLEELLAPRTYEESGDYSLGKYQLEIQEIWNDGTNGGYFNKIQDLKDAAGYLNITFSSSDDNAIIEESKEYFACTVKSPGSSVAYVKGHRVEPPEPETLWVRKARQTYNDVNSEDLNASITAAVGNYVTVTISDGLPEFDSFSAIYSLYDSSSPSFSEENIVGTCKIRTIESLGNNQARLYLHNIILEPNRLFSEVVAIRSDSIIANNYGQPIFILTEPGILNDSNFSSSLYRWPVSVVNNVTDITLTEKRSSVTNLNIANNSVTVTYSVDGEDETFADSGPTNILATYYDDSESKYITFSDFDIVVNLNAKSLTLNLTDSLGGGQLYEAGVISAAADKVRIIYSVNTQLDNLGIKRYTTVTNSTAFTPITPSENISVGDIVTLDDVYHLISIEPNADGIIEWEIVNDGQRDTEYVEATIRALVSNPASISYTHWQFTGSGQNYYTRNSYQYESGATIEDKDLSLLPIYNNTPLNEFLDLRLRGNTNDRIALDPYSTINAKLNYYLSRRDLVVVNTGGYYNVVYGSSAAYPEVNKDSMPIVNLDIPAYTFDLRNIQTRNINNRRYTMRDIGDLEERIETLEYYTTLSLLERSAADESIYADTGEERFKNGFIVDGFRNHIVGNTLDSKYRCSVDNIKGRLYPYFRPSGVPFVVDENNISDILPGNGYTNSGLSNSTITCRFNKVDWLVQDQATQMISVQPHDIVAFNGDMQLFPEEDMFVDVTRNPEIEVTAISDSFAAVADSLKLLGEEIGTFGTVHERWETYDRVLLNYWKSGDTEYWKYDLYQSRESTTTDLVYETEDVSLGRYVSDISLKPYMRSRPVKFYVQDLLPNARFYAFFDNIDVSDYCIATLNPRYYQVGELIPVPSDKYIVNGTLSQNIEDETDREYVDYAANYLSTRLFVGDTTTILKSNDQGILEGWFFIPNNDEVRFFAGEKTFKLTTSPRNLSDEEISFAAAKFISGGVEATTDERIVSVGVPTVEVTYDTEYRVKPYTRSETKPRPPAPKHPDPIAQSFRVEEKTGVFLTGVSLYFGAKPALSGTYSGRMDSVEAYIVTMRNGYPTKDIVPGSRSSRRVEEVNISDDGSVATDFNFKYPVYLSPEEEYALVCFSMSPDYFAYIADLGDVDLITDEIISGQADVGVFFTGSNRTTWSAQQNRDLKFKLQRASFDTATRAIVPAPTAVGEYISSVIVEDGGSGYLLTDTVQFPPPNDEDGVQATGTLIIDVSTGSITGVRITNPGLGYTSVPTSAMVIETSAGENAILRPALEKIEVSTFMFNQKVINIDGITSVNNQIVLDDKSYIDIQNGNVITDLKSKEHVITAENDKNNKLIMTLQTNDDFVSPIIKRDTLSLNSRKYVISNVEENTSVYISKRMTLGNPADQINGWIAINRPTAAANVKVYVRLYDANGKEINNEDSEWWEISPFSSNAIPTNSNRDKYDEVQFVRSFENEVEFSSFVIKIVLLSSNHVDIPSCKDLRFIATS